MSEYTCPKHPTSPHRGDAESPEPMECAACAFAERDKLRADLAAERAAAKRAEIECEELRTHLSSDEAAEVQRSSQALIDRMHAEIAEIKAERDAAKRMHEEDLQAWNRREAQLIADREVAEANAANLENAVHQSGCTAALKSVCSCGADKKRRRLLTRFTRFYAVLNQSFPEVDNGQKTDDQVVREFGERIETIRTERDQARKALAEAQAWAAALRAAWPRNQRIVLGIGTEDDVAAVNAALSGAAGRELLERVERLKAALIAASGGGRESGSGAGDAGGCPPSLQAPPEDTGAIKNKRVRCPTCGILVTTAADCDQAEWCPNCDRKPSTGRRQP